MTFGASLQTPLRGQNRAFGRERARIWAYGVEPVVNRPADGAPADAGAAVSGQRRG